METIYVLFDYDTEDVIISRDKHLLEEIMCDYCMEEVVHDFNWRINYQNETPSPELAQTCWNDTLEYFSNYMGLREETII